MSHTALIFSICGLGIVLNSCEIASLIYAKRTTLPFDITIISLAMSDLMFVLTSLVLSSFIYYVPNWIASERYYMAFAYSTYSSFLSSVLHMVFIAIQRLIAVLYPLKTSIWITRRRSIITVLLLWLASVAVAAPVPMGFYIYNRILLFSPFVAIGVIAACYFVINFRMMTRKSPTGGDQQTQNISILVYSISVTAIFMICIFPATVYVMSQGVLMSKMQFPDYATYLLYLQTVLDPLVYFFFQIWKRGRCTLCCSSCQCRVSSNVSGHLEMRGTNH